jgi:hypothetical protein
MAASGNGKKWASDKSKKTVGTNGSKPTYSGNGKKSDLTVKQTLNG